jgi:hypothetical protein
VFNCRPVLIRMERRVGLWRNMVYGAGILSLNRYSYAVKGKIHSPLEPAMVTSCLGVLVDGGESNGDMTKRTVEWI